MIKTIVKMKVKIYMRIKPLDFRIHKKKIKKMKTFMQKKKIMKEVFWVVEVYLVVEVYSIIKKKLVI
jgi:hypothetical protein